MYFLQQYKRQFQNCYLAYQQNPETKGEVEAPQSPLESQLNTETLRERAARLATRLGEGLEQVGARLENLYRGSESGEEASEVPELEAFSSEQVLGTLQATPAEMETVRQEILQESGGTEVSEIQDSQVQERIFQQRQAAQQTSVINDGDREIVESAFITEIAQENNISPELLGDLRALGFEGSQNWQADEIAQNMRILGEDLQTLRVQVEANGGTFPESPEEFLALWEQLNQNEGEASPAIDPAAAAAQGINAIRSPDGGFQIDPNTPGYSQVGDAVVGPPGAPYSYGGQVYGGMPNGEISTEVNANLDASYSGLQQNSPNPLSPDQASALQNPENKEIIEQRIPPEWHGAGVKMANEIGRMDGTKVIALASMTEKRAVVCYPDGKIDEFPIVIGRGGYREGAHSGGGTTPTYEVFNFNGANVPGRGMDASRGGSSTVIGAAVFSPEGEASGGKWWHGVADSRIPGGATLGCIGAKQENMMMLGRAVQQAGGGYGFHTNTKNG